MFSSSVCSDCAFQSPPDDSVDSSDFDSSDSSATASAKSMEVNEPSNRNFNITSPVNTSIVSYPKQCGDAFQMDSSGRSKVG